jgi:hypothetical protein
VLSTIAATLLVSTVGLGIWDVRLQEERNRPVANVPSLILELAPRALGEETVAVAPGKPLRVVLTPAEDCPVYQAEIEPPGRERWTLAGLKKDASGNLTLQLPRPEPGSYRLRLSGCEPRREQEYSWRIARPDRPEADGD